MKKVEILKELLSKVEEQIEGKLQFAKSVYLDDCGGKNCVIGHLLLLGGATQDQLRSLDNETHYDSYGIMSIIRSINIQGEDPGFIDSTLKNIGFNIIKSKDPSDLENIGYEIFYDHDIKFLKDAQSLNDRGMVEDLKKLIEDKITVELSRASK